MTPATPTDASSQLDPALRAELDDRYGRTPRRGRRWRWIIFGVLAAGAVGYLGWTALAPSIDAVSVDDLAMSVTDAHSVTIDFQATLRQGAALTCVLEAQDTDHGVVGWKVVQYPADDAHTRRFGETIPTVAEATTGLVTSCWIP